MHDGIVNLVLVVVQFLLDNDVFVFCVVLLCSGGVNKAVSFCLVAGCEKLMFTRCTRWIGRE